MKPDATAADVRAMRVDEAKAIYRRRYWDAQRCDELPAGVDYAVFDYGVNSGIGRSGKVLRRVLGLAADTSAVTDAVIAAARGADSRRRHRRDLRRAPAVSEIAEDLGRVRQRLGPSRRRGEGGGARHGGAPAPRANGPVKAGGAVVAAGGAAAAAHQAGLPLIAIIVIAIAAALAIALGIHLVASRKG